MDDKPFGSGCVDADTKLELSRMETRIKDSFASALSESNDRQEARLKELFYTKFEKIEDDSKRHSDNDKRLFDRMDAIEDRVSNIEGQKSGETNAGNQHTGRQTLFWTAAAVIVAIALFALGAVSNPLSNLPPAQAVQTKNDITVEE